MDRRAGKKVARANPRGRSPIIAPRPVLDAARRPETDASTPKCTDHALPAGSVGLQDRAAWPASVFGDQRGHAGDVCGDPRTLHACHAKEETLFLRHRDLLTLSFSRSVTPETSRRRRSRAQNASKRQNRRPKRRHAAQNGLKILLRPTRPPYPKTHRGFNLPSEPGVRPCQRLRPTL